MSIISKIRATLLLVPTLLWNMLLGRVLKVRHWWDRIDENLIVGALPLPSDVPRLADHGVSGVVNTCAEYAGPVEAYREQGITQLRIPTTDFTHPKLDDVVRAVKFVNEQVADGSSVYVHCKAGRARSATVAMCWLISARDMTPEQAQRLLLEKRPHTNRYIYARDVVKVFYEKHLASVARANQ